MVQILRNIAICYLFLRLIAFVQANWSNENNRDEQLFEGDIEGVPKHAYDNALRSDGDQNFDNAFRWTYAHWPNGIVPYVIQQGFFSKTQMNLLQEVMKNFEYQTCIKFVQRHNQTNYIHIKFNIVKCSSDVSMIGGEQIVWLTGSCISDRNDILHLLMHVLGFYHEQNRPDRDKYVKINAENIHPNKLYNFKIQHESNFRTFDTPYDFKSIMHYKSHSFSINGKPTIEPREKGVEIKADGLSLLDLTEINRMYNCPEETTVNLPCVCSSCDHEIVPEGSNTKATTHNFKKENRTAHWEYYLWPNGIVPYTIDVAFLPLERSVIENVMHHVSQVSCVRFVERHKEEYYMSIKYSYTYCYAEGFWNERAKIVHLTQHCLTLNSILHHVMHAMGFYHEHQRPDRDKYILINWDNVYNHTNNTGFKIVNTYFDTPYDFKSILHGPGTFQSKNGFETITPREHWVQIKSEGLTQFDVLKINRLYDCSKETNEKIKLISNNAKSGTSAPFRRHRAAPIQWKYQTWPNGVIPYVISKFSSLQKFVIETTMKEITDVSCVKFRPRTSEENYLHITFNSFICATTVGFQNEGEQTMRLTSDCILNRNAILHEFMHVLGFFHEHNRPDRDNYVIVHWENIDESRRRYFNFIKESYNDMTYFDTPYDFASVTHYPADAYSQSGKPTITPIEDGTKIKADGLSKIDILKINRLYKCSEEVKKKVPLICYCECPKIWFAKPPFAPSSTNKPRHMKIETHETKYVSSGNIAIKSGGFSVIYGHLVIYFLYKMCYSKTFY